MKLKVNLQITGTVEEVVEGEQATLFDNDPVTDAQLWRLTKEGLPAFIVEQLTKREAGKIIGMYEVKKRNNEVMQEMGVKTMPVKSLMQQFVEKKEERGETVALPWEGKPKCSFVGCTNNAVTKGLCQKHYMAQYNKGKKAKK